MNVPASFVEVNDYYYIPFWKTTSFVIMGSLLGLLVLILCSWLLYRVIKYWINLRNQLTVLEQLYAQIQRLKPSSNLSDDQLRAWYGQASDLLKKYIAQLHGANCAACTDDELYAMMVHMIKAQQAHGAEQLLPLLKRAVLIKFSPDGIHDFVAQDWALLEQLLKAATDEERESR